MILLMKPKSLDIRHQLSEVVRGATDSARMQPYLLQAPVIRSAGTSCRSRVHCSGAIADDSVLLGVVVREIAAPVGIEIIVQFLQRKIVRKEMRLFRACETYLRVRRQILA